MTPHCSNLRFNHLKFVAVAALLAASLSNAMAAGSLPEAAPQARQFIALPLVAGWYDGHAVQYVTTDVSDPDAALDMGANYVPRLANALLPGGPGKPGAVERIYRVVNFNQGSVLPSIPEPAGATNRNRSYSPIWQVYQVTWDASATPHLLRSEEEILDAEEKKQLTIAKTMIVVNCPVIFAAGASLPGAVIETLPATP